LFAIMLTERVTGDDARDITSRGSFWGWAAALAVLVVLLLPAIQGADLSQVAKPINPSVKALGQQMMEPYVVTLEVLALLLTAALIGAVAASQGGEKTKEDTDDA
jgi:NADH:ubiquinone oxidoreductase subunit 6 (subunit J)